MDVEGPIQRDDELPFGSAMQPGTSLCRMLEAFDYVEEELFVTGTATVYGPSSPRALEPGERTIDLAPLSTPLRADQPYRTRVLLLRPRDPTRFSGTVHAQPFHPVLGNTSWVERDLARAGHAWVSVEVCDGARHGRDEVPGGGLATLHGANPARYGSLALSAGDQSEWGQLEPGAVGRAFASLNVSETTPNLQAFSGELFRSCAQAPDIYLDLVRGLRSGEHTVLPGFAVRRVYASGVSGGTMALQAIVDHHHDRNLLPDGSPLVDGYLLMVGMTPSRRPAGDAVVASFQTEAEVLKRIADGEAPPIDSDEPRFRYYELPGAGHSISAREPDRSLGARIDDVLPAGVQGLTVREVPDGVEEYDKFNAPIIWALWSAMYQWTEAGVPMPRAPRIERDPSAPDGISRDVHGNALGGLRTPWVDVPDAHYLARMARDNPLTPGMQRFTDSEMQALYGSRDVYTRRIQQRVDQMVADRWLLAEDVPLLVP